MTAPILITGGAGFLGSHLADVLLDAGHRVVVLDDLSTGDPENLAGARARHGERLTLVQGCVTDRDAVRAAAQGVGHVFHLAAMVGVRRVVEDPLRTLDVNVNGARRVFEAALEVGAPVVFASTSEVYGNDGGYRELLAEDSRLVLAPPTHLRGGYGASKFSGELLARALHERDGLRVACLRLFSAVGPRQSPAYGMVLPRFVHQALEGEPLTVHGSGRQTRCFTAVHDVARALAAHVDRDLGFELVNYGSDVRTSVLDLARAVLARTGSASPLVHVPHAEVFGAHFEDSEHRVPDLTRMRESGLPLPTTPLADVLDEVIAYVRARPGVYAGV